MGIVLKVVPEVAPLFEELPTLIFGCMNLR